MSLTVTSASLDGVLVLEPKIFNDSRGYFFESFNFNSFTTATGIDASFVQDNISNSSLGVLRGLHYQINQPQGKLVSVITGSVYDVAVDLRKDSNNFGKSVGIKLSAINKKMLWIPEGFAHGFLALENSTNVLYKTTNYYSPKDERCILWNDPSLNIRWPLIVNVLLSERDLNGSAFVDAEYYF